MSSLAVAWWVATTALTAAPAFSNMNPQSPPGIRRSSGGAVRIGPAGNESFVSFAGFSGGTLTDLAQYLPLINTWVGTASAPPPARERHGLAYDPVHDVFVIVGGADGFTLYDTVYLINGSSLMTTTPVTPATRPSARIDPLLQWIPAWGKFLYFGGRTSVFANNHVNDLWSLDVGDGGVTWTSLANLGPPSQRGAVCSALDPNTGNVIVFGGEASAMAADTWSYKPDAGTWTQLTVTGTVPSARGFAACAWDPNLNQLVLYGGQLTSAPTNGLFTFDPQSRVWTSLTAPADPGVLSDSAAGYSPALGGTIFFGGRNGASTYTNQTWLLTFNAAPEVDAGVDFSVGENVMTALSGSIFDPDGDPTTALWAQTAGPMVTLSSTTALAPTFTTPRVLTNTTLTFVLTGSDATSNVSDGVNVTVLNNINEAPFADAGTDQLVDAGVVVTLMGSGVDPNGDPIVSYSWAQVSGPAVTLITPLLQTASFVAPSGALPVTLAFELVVRDAASSSSPDRVLINVEAVVDAGLEDAGTDAGEVDGGEIDGGQRDGGETDAGGTDAGIDAGAGVDAGPGDAGSENYDAGPMDVRQLSVGCGCTEVPFSAVWMLLALLQFARGAGRKSRK